MHETIIWPFTTITNNTQLSTVISIFIVQSSHYKLQIWYIIKSKSPNMKLQSHIIFTWFDLCVHYKMRPLTSTQITQKLNAIPARHTYTYTAIANVYNPCHSDRGVHDAWNPISGLSLQHTKTWECPLHLSSFITILPYSHTHTHTPV